MRYSKLAVEAPLEVGQKSDRTGRRPAKISPKVGKNRAIQLRIREAEKTMKAQGAKYPQTGETAEKTRKGARKLANFFGDPGPETGRPKKPPQTLG